MLVAQGLGRYQSQKCLYEGQFEQGKPDYNGRVVVRDGKSNQGTMTETSASDIMNMYEPKNDNGKTYNNIFNKTKTCMQSYGLIQKKVSSNFNMLQQEILRDSWNQVSVNGSYMEIFNYSISYDLYTMPGFW